MNGLYGLYGLCSTVSTGLTDVILHAESAIRHPPSVTPSPVIRHPPSAFCDLIRMKILRNQPSDSLRPHRPSSRDEDEVAISVYMLQDTTASVSAE